MESPSSGSSSNPDLRVSYLSEIDPGNKFEINVTAPPGDIPINTLKVLWLECHLLEFR